MPTFFGSQTNHLLNHTCSSCLLALALTITGCQTASPIGHPYQNALMESRQSILQGQFGLARTYLKEARTLALQQDNSTVDADLLEAEMALREQNTADAIQIVRTILSNNPHNPFAQEVLGKAILVQGGPFADAQQAFSKTKADYIKPADQQRATDLMALSQGLSFYATGDLTAANISFNHISDPKLKSSVDHAQGQAQAQDQAAEQSTVGQ